MHQISYLNKFESLIHGISTRNEGNMSFRWGSESQVLENRKAFLNRLGIAMEDTAAMFNQHTNNFQVITEEDKSKGMFNVKEAIKVDGLVTTQSGLYLFLLVADCQPIIVVEPDKMIVGLFHAGWRNIVAGFAKATVNLMCDNFDINEANLHVIIGPSIHQKSYRFSEVQQHGDSEWAPFIKKYGKNNFGLDLVGYNKQQFLKAGISENRLFISDIDTADDKRFFSHFYDSKNQPEKEGRFAVVVGWED